MFAWFQMEHQSIWSQIFFLLIQVLHILTENLQSPSTITFGVTGNQPAKI